MIKSGSQGVGPQQYISGNTPLRYVISFSNESAASAPAQKVIVTDQLDLTDDDLNTFSIGGIIQYRINLSLPLLALGIFQALLISGLPTICSWP